LWVRLGRGEGARLAKLALLPLSVWSMSLAHLGAGVLTIGAVAETAFRAEQAVAMTPGQTIVFAGRDITLVEITAGEGPNYSAQRANFRVEQAGRVQALAAEKRFYPTSPMPTTEVGILSSWDGDLYIAIGEPERGSTAWTVRLYHNPLVQLVFLGAAMMALGGALSLLALLRRKGKSP
jgi:cytochrome c-type biogenesis protein CcmF